MTDIRLWNLDTKTAEKFIASLKRNKGAADTVWLSTLSGHPKFKEHEKCAEELVKIADMFRKNSINVSLQLSNSLGHGDSFGYEEREKGLLGKEIEHAAGPDGHYAKYCYCFYGENFREYIKKTTELYSKIQPDVFWVDDDLRPTNHLPVEIMCYCDQCIERFNKKHNTSFSREELVHEINYGDIIWRERYIEQVKRGMYEFAYIIAKAIRKDSPNTVMAYQYGRFNNYLGGNYNCIIDGFHDASGLPVMTRPGGGFYHDKKPDDMLFKALQLNCANAVLNKNVSGNYPEIENIPDVYFGKSFEGTCKEACLYLAYGCDGLSFAAFNRGQEDNEYEDKMYSWFSKYSPYWKELTDMNQRAKVGGVGVYETENAYKKSLKPEDELFSWMKIPGVWDTNLMKIGVPVSSDNTVCDSYILYPEVIDYMTDDDIFDLLKKPVIVGGEAVIKLFDRGFGKCFGIDIKKFSVGLGKEYLSDHPVNGENDGKYTAESYFVNWMVPDVYIISDNDGKTEPLGYFKANKTEEILGVSSAICQTYDNNGKKASKWAVIGYNFNNDIVSSFKRDQIINAADYISGKKLPAKLISKEQIVVIPRVDDDKKTVSVSLQSCSIGTSGELELVIREPKSEDFRLSDLYTRCEKIKYEKKGDDYIVKIPAIGSWEMKTVFCK